MEYDFDNRSEYNFRNYNRSRNLNAGTRRLRSRRRAGYRIFKYIIVAIASIMLIAIGVYAIVRYVNYRKEKKEISSYNTSQMKQDIYLDFSILGIDKPIAIKGLTKQEVYDKVLGTYKYDIKIHNSNPEIDIFEMPVYGEKEKDEDLTKFMKGKENDSLGTGQEVEVENPLADITIKATKDTFDLPDFVEGQAIKFIDDLYDKYLYISTNEFSKKKVDVNADDFVADFKFETSLNDDLLDSALSQLARLWNTKAVKGQIEGFSREKNEFTFGDDHQGFVVDEDELRKKIVDEVNKGNLETEIWTILKTINTDAQSIKARYKYVSVFETWTTDNEKRNNNIRLACQAINGLVIKTGQEFSFNNIVGERTEERGYDYAPAYLEGQVVEELGGGVCQVSTTLYNAIFNAGITTTYRKSHTFEPSYITPGLDATVSYHGPDYRFINNSEYSVGIRATYAKEKVKIEIFAVPLLKEGYTQNLVSKKIQDLEFPTLSIITEGKASKGSQGSEWQVFKVVKKDGKETERTFDHQAVYQGHTPTAFEEYTYIDDDGVLQTKKFVETMKSESTKRVVTTTAIRENKIKDIAPTESSTGDNNGREE